MSNYAVLARYQLGDIEQKELLHELLCYDALCYRSMHFVYDEIGTLHQEFPPSPLHWSRQIEWTWALRQGGFDRSHYCLDIGSGWSVVQYAIARRVWQLASIDIDEESIAYASETTQRLRNFGILSRDNIFRKCADAKSLPYADNSFDRVSCFSVIEHMADGHVQAVREMKRVLRPGGRLLLTMDLKIKGGVDDNFYVDVPLARDMLDELEIEGICQPEDNLLMGAELKGVSVVVVLVCWDKPK